MLGHIQDHSCTPTCDSQEMPVGVIPLLKSSCQPCAAVAEVQHGLLDNCIKLAIEFVL